MVLRTLRQRTCPSESRRLFENDYGARVSENFSSRRSSEATICGHAWWLCQIGNRRVNPHRRAHAIDCSGTQLPKFLPLGRWSNRPCFSSKTRGYIGRPRGSSRRSCLRAACALPLGGHGRHARVRGNWLTQQHWVGSTRILPQNDHWGTV